MAFPSKFKHWLEINSKDIEIPDYVWLTYAVCAVTNRGCGWGGWIIEGAFRESPNDNLSNAMCRFSVLQKHVELQWSVSLLHIDDDGERMGQHLSVDSTGQVPEVSCPDMFDVEAVG